MHKMICSWGTVQVSEEMKIEVKVRSAHTKCQSDSVLICYTALETSFITNC